MANFGKLQLGIRLFNEIPQFSSAHFITRGQFPLFNALHFPSAMQWQTSANFNWVSGRPESASQVFGQSQRQKQACQIKSELIILTRTSKNKSMSTTLWSRIFRYGLERINESVHCLIVCFLEVSSNLIHPNGYKWCGLEIRFQGTASMKSSQTAVQDKCTISVQCKKIQSKMRPTAVQDKCTTSLQCKILKCTISEQCKKSSQRYVQQQCKISVLG